MTLRAVLLGLALLPFNAWWLIQIEYVRYSDTPTIPQLFFHCVAVLLALVVLNLPLQRLAPRVAFGRGELLTIYTMLVIGSNLAGHDQLQILFTSIFYIHGRATPENAWALTIHPHLPPWLVIRDAAAIEMALRGHSSLAEHWRPWLVPLLAWSGFALTVAGTMFCMAALLRRQWDHERLTYPLAEIPLAVAGAPDALFRQPVFWAGAGLAASLQMLNLCHQIWPAVPGVNLGVRLVTFNEFPWRHMGTLPICFYPFALGLAFLLPTQLTFSCLFFFALTRAERIVAALFGFTDWNGFPYVDQQSSGAFVGFGLFVLWAARRHLAYTLRVALGRESGPSPGSEPLSYRAAWIGLLVGSGVLLGFTVMCGMRFWAALTYWLLLACIVLAVARVRAEVGLPSIELYQRGADDMMRRALGTGELRPVELTVLTLLFWLNRTQRNYNLQHQLHGLRLAAVERADMRRFAGAIALATGVGVVVAFGALLAGVYQTGLEGGSFTGPAAWAFGNDPWQKLGRHLQVSEPAQPGGTVAYGFGAAVTWLLVIARVRFVWWPLHPVGFVVGNSFALLRLWVPIALAWLIKSNLLRYAGLRAYRATLPFFVGLAVGEFTAGFLRTLIDLAFGLHLPADSGIGGL